LGLQFTASLCCLVLSCALESIALESTALESVALESVPSQVVWNAKADPPSPDPPQPPPQLPVLRRIVQEEGAAALWRGIGPRVLFHAPSAAVCWGTYESMKTMLQAY